MESNDLARIESLDTLISQLESQLRSNRLWPQALGRLLPGMRALPAFTILGSDLSRHAPRLEPGQEPRDLETGDLLKVHTTDERSPTADLYVTPIGQNRLHPVGISAVEDQPTAFRRVVRVEGKPVDGSLELQFAILPWIMGASTPTGNGGRIAKDLLSAAAVRSHLVVRVEYAGGETAEVQPDWGVRPGSFDPIASGLRILTSRAASVLDNCILRIELCRPLMAEDKDLVQCTVTFEIGELDQRELRGIHWEAKGVEPGIQLVCQAIPAMNLELKMWQAGTPFSKFDQESGGNFVTFAGIGTFQSDVSRVLRGLTFTDMTLRLEQSRNGQTDLWHDIHAFDVQGGPGEVPVVFAWITQAQYLNGIRASYMKQDPSQNREIRCDFYDRASTAIPFVEGRSLGEPEGDETEDLLRLTLMAQPQMFLFPDGLYAAARQQFRALGYLNVDVETPMPPRICVRVVEGVRQRVFLIRVRAHQTSVQAGDIRLVEQYLSGVTPTGLHCAVELVQP